MNFSSSAKSLVRQLVKRNDLSPEICYTYLFARANGHPTYYFPDGYDALDAAPKSSIFNEKLDPEWVKGWIKLWPTQKETNLDYAVSGAYPNCMKQFTKFLKEWNDRVGDCCEDLSLEDKLDLIEESTKAYLKFREDRNWEYTKKNHKFIIDTKGSELEQWIRKVATNQIKQTKSFAL